MCVMAWCAQGAAVRDAQGMVPLHVALSTGAAKEVVLKVLEAHPEVAWIAELQWAWPYCY